MKFGDRLCWYASFPFDTMVAVVGHGRPISAPTLYGRLVGINFTVLGCWVWWCICFSFVTVVAAVIGGINIILGDVVLYFA